VRVLLLDPFSGASGDMFLGMLVDLGLNFETLKAQIGKLGLDGYHLEKSRVRKNSIAASKVDVVLDAEFPQPARTLKDILEIISRAELDSSVKHQAESVFQCLAVAEAKVHDSTPDRIHFHEVGAVDSIVDIVGAVWGIDRLSVEEIWSRAPTLGSGFVSSAHGKIPLPSPATLEVLQGVPVISSSITGELTTPTGAALIKTLVSRYVDSVEVNVQNIGYGAGSKDFEQPNVLRGMIAETTDHPSQSVWQIEVNIDDMNPQLFPVLVEGLLESGALDAWVSSSIMKKGRPGFQLAVLVAQQNKDAVIQRVFAESTTLGLRYWKVNRSILDRHFEDVDTQWGKVKIKIGSQGNKTLHVQPEFESVRQLASDKSISVKQVLEAAQQEAYKKFLVP